MFFFVSTVLNFASTVLNFASTVFFFVSPVLNFASTVFFFVSTVLNHRQGGVRSYPPSHGSMNSATECIRGGVGGGGCVKLLKILFNASLRVLELCAYRQ